MDDLDIEMGDAVDVPMEEIQAPEIMPLGEQPEDGEVEELVNGQTADAEPQQVERNKIHITGLDTLNADELKAYVAATLNGKQADRVEWVDDYSANLVFSSDVTAQDALLALSAVEIVSTENLAPLELLPAKPFSPKPDVLLQVRFALESDKKQRGAAQRSRFYLMNPEWDPETEEGRRRRYRDRDDSRYRDRRGGRPRRNDRYDDEEPEKFDASLYDDDAGTLAKRASEGRTGRLSGSPSDRSDSDRYRSYSSRNRGKELFPSARADTLRSGRNGGSRTRSASPPRDVDGDRAMDDVARDREVARNRERARAIRDRLSRDNRNGSQNSTKELFPGKLSTSRKPQMDQVAAEESVAVSLSDRISTAPTNVSDDGMSIRGLADKTTSDRGISIKGKGTSVRELFPNKFSSSNAGKELFADKLEGRGRRRQKAEDMFH